MKRYSLIYIAFALLIVCAAASSVLASFPKIDGKITLPMHQGWFDDTVAWFISTDTNNIRYATTENLTLAPELSSAIGNAARKMYIVTNFNNSGPVFETAPTASSPYYSGLWQICFVTWKPGVTPHVITNTDSESGGNPTGLPNNTKVFLTSSPFVGYPEPRIVVDCPIVALGSLASPAGNPQFGGIYRIPQVISLNTLSVPKTITLPTFNVYCQDAITTKLGVKRVIIPDVEEPTLAKLLKANFAPGLGALPFSDTQRFWVINWKQPNGGGVFVVPPAQFAVVEQCPTAFSWRNSNFDYTPIGRYTLLDRDFDPVNYPGFTDKTVIKTPEFIEELMEDGLLDVVYENHRRINAPQVPNIL
ncbi:MAG: hypothetical protein NT018_06015 [Armatimonadetes bacterium]|nr:hypothetical protein [Armatimonadota bacterium]